MASKCKYEIIIYWSGEDEAYVAEVPELPGCAADGPTYKQAVSNAEVVIGEWIETARMRQDPGALGHWRLDEPAAIRGFARDA